MLDDTARMFHASRAALLLDICVNDADAVNHRDDEL